MINRWNLLLTCTAMFIVTGSAHSQYAWTRITPSGLRNISNLAIAPSDAAVIYLSVEEDAVWRGEGDEEFEWIKLSTFEGCEGVRHIAVHPSDPYELYVTAGG